MFVISLLNSDRLIDRKRPANKMATTKMAATRTTPSTGSHVTTAVAMAVT